MLYAYIFSRAKLFKLLGERYKGVCESTFSP